MNKKLDFEFKDNLLEGLNEDCQEGLLSLLQDTDLLDDLDKHEQVKLISASHEERLAYLTNYLKGYASKIQDLETLEGSYGLAPLCLRMAQFWLEGAEAFTVARETRASELKSETKVS